MASALPATMAETDVSLEDYHGKRNFERTPEPKDGGESGEGGRFVFHKHDASSLHYDFRLEAGGVLKSWAVPKGPSTDPSEKRLAVETEDHPVKYLDFEGVIPEDEYGGGTVLVWDIGTYRNLREEKDDSESMNMEESIDDGLVEVWLEGEKLAGGYSLKRIESGSKPKWLLVKMDDEEADARRRPLNTEQDSVVSDRSLDEIASEEGEKED